MKESKQELRIYKSKLTIWKAKCDQKVKQTVNLIVAGK